MPELLNSMSLGLFCCSCTGPHIVSQKVLRLYVTMTQAPIPPLFLHRLQQVPSRFRSFAEISDESEAAPTFMPLATCLLAPHYIFAAQDSPTGKDSIIFSVASGSASLLCASSCLRFLR